MSHLAIVSMILQERLRQDEKFGEQNIGPAPWLVILGEEFGECCRAVCDGDIKNLRKELIQVAAVAVAMLQCAERNDWK